MTAPPGSPKYAQGRLNNYPDFPAYLGEVPDRAEGVETRIRPRVGLIRVSTRRIGAG
jgi:hypothetical protein